MATVIRLYSGFTDSLRRVHVKGAAEVVLKKCTSYVDWDGSVKPLTPEQIEHLTGNVLDSMNKMGLRTLCVAFRNLDEMAGEIDWEDEEKVIGELTCLALLGLEDPVRPEVAETIRKCQEAGVVVRMVTGDNLNTARAIALKCGIIKPDEDFIAMDSSEFNESMFDQWGNLEVEKFDEVHFSYILFLE